MDTPSMNWMRLIQLGDDPSGRRRARLALAVTPPELAQGLKALITMSHEHRDLGLLVTNVGPGSQAAAAGIERGDMLLRYDGVPLETTEQLKRLEGVLARVDTPRQVELAAVRGEREMTFTATAGRLGITVSAMLHRWDSSRQATAEPLLGIWQVDQLASAGKPALLDVPDELVRPVSLLAEVLRRPRNAKQRKRVEAILVTAAGMG